MAPAPESEAATSIPDAAAFTQWTAADLAERFGPIPLHRIRRNPPPGTATVGDVVRIEQREDRLFELIDGVLVEKTVGAYESYLAMLIGHLIGNFNEEHRLGIVLGADGMIELRPHQVRIPDAAFVGWKTLEGSGFPENPAPRLAPDLAVEVLSEANTAKEMDRKLQEYFRAGTRLVWYVDPRKKRVQVFTSPDDVETLSEGDTLTGGDVLPGLAISLADYFQPPQPEERGL